MKKKIHVTLIQADLQSEDVDLNLSNFDKLLTKVKKSDIILLPETFNTGFCIKSTHLAEKMNGPTISWMKAKSKEKNCAIAGTLMVTDKGKIYNRLIWISKNKKIYTYDNTVLYHCLTLMNQLHIEMKTYFQYFTFCRWYVVQSGSTVNCKTMKMDETSYRLFLLIHLYFQNPL